MANIFLLREKTIYFSLYPKPLLFATVFTRALQTNIFIRKAANYLFNRSDLLTNGFQSNKITIYLNDKESR